MEQPETAEYTYLGCGKVYQYLFTNVMRSKFVILLVYPHFTTQETPECIGSGTNFERSSLQNMHSTKIQK